MRPRGGMTSSNTTSADWYGKCIRRGADRDRKRGKAPCPYAQKFDLKGGKDLEGEGLFLLQCTLFLKTQGKTLKF